MNLITCQRHHLEERCRERGATWEQVQPCIVSRDGDTITVEVDHPAYPSKYNQRYWPRLARMVAKLRKPDEIGVGDTIKRCLSLIGANDMAQAYTLLTGEDCGCAERRRKLNERYPYT